MLRSSLHLGIMTAAKAARRHGAARCARRTASPRPRLPAHLYRFELVQRPAAPGLLPALSCRRIVGRIFVHRVGGTVTGDEDDHGLVASHREVRPIRGFGVDGTDGQRLQLGLVELRAVPEVPSAFEYGPDPVTSIVGRWDPAPRPGL